MRYVPHNYQEYAEEWIMNKPKSGLFMDMGLGKTIITLTAINRLIYEEVAVRKVLVVSTVRVIKTVWRQEAAKWDHTKHLRFSLVWGNSQLERVQALRKEADIYLINREMIPWLVNLLQSNWPFDMVVLDESSSFKDPSTQRFRAMKLELPKINRLVLLTGTPASNSIVNIWSQIYLLDQGQRLEKTITAFREVYLTPEGRDGYMVFSYRPKKGAEDRIYEKIGDICISMKDKDYLQLPKLIENDILLDLPTEAQKAYDKFEQDSIIQLIKESGDIDHITAMNAAALTNKLLQMANGAVYHEDRSFTVIHDEKLNALEELLEEAQGKPILCFYTYQHDYKRILERFKFARLLREDKDIQDWNLKKIRLLVAHPASAGHGLNLQYGGNIITWFGQTWSLELYLQGLKRIHRQGQRENVIMNRLLMRGTMDEEVISSLARKEVGQNALMHALRARIERVISRQPVG